MSKTAKLTLDNRSYEFPIIEGTEGEKAIDISKLRATTGHITMDIGFGNTGSCTSKITFLDGEKGILRYRGVPIEQVADKASFLEVSWLLNYGEMPTAEQKKKYIHAIKLNNRLPEGVRRLIESFPIDAHPMAVMSSACVALAGHYPELCVAELSEQQKDKLLAMFMGQLKIIAARFFHHAQGTAPILSDPTLRYSADFLNMFFGKWDEDVAKALDVLLILHADHEQNCSASTTRVIGSGHANIFASIAGGINALWGPLHGGANQAVIEMLDRIHTDGGDYRKFLDKAKDKNDSFRLMGFGHRVYKNFDPRARIIKQACDKVLDKLGIHDPVLDIAKGLEEEALKDPYFVERKLYPNVDFYSGIIYRAMGIPTYFFTVMFVLGRLPGWFSQWKEMIESNETKICRPRQIYTGPNQRDL